MALADKFQDLMSQMEAMKSEVAELEKPASDAGVDMSKLQDQIKALGEERDKKAKEAADLRAAIQAEIDDQDADTKRLEKALAPIEEVPVQAPVPEVPAQDAGQGPSPAGDTSSVGEIQSPAKPDQPTDVAQPGQPAESNEQKNDQLTDITKG